jgi:phage-related baseplate assembly protein
MSAPIDLTLLPMPQVVEVLDFEEILATRKSAVIELMPEEDREATAAMLELESEPAVKLLEENSYQEIVLRNRVNDAALAVMLPYSKKDDLDNLGANANVKRLTVVAADPTATPPTAAVMEDDEAYRLRIQESSDGYSVAGPRSAYEFHARSADGRVKDVRAISPAPCEIVIVVLSTAADGIAPADLLSVVLEAVNGEEVRPLGDLVTAQSATVEDYEVEATLYVAKGPEAPIALAAAQQNAAAISTPRRPLGFSIYRSAYIGALKVEGVVNVVLTSPAADILRNKTQAARCTAIRIKTEIIEEADDE